MAREFGKEEISALSTIAFQVSSILVNARLLDSIHKKEAETQRVTEELAAARQSMISHDEVEPAAGQTSYNFV